jgi:hypothetical protein
VDGLGLGLGAAGETVGAGQRAALMTRLARRSTCLRSPPGQARRDPDDAGGRVSEFMRICSQVPVRRRRVIVAFGDSYADDGNLFELLGIPRPQSTRTAASPTAPTSSTRWRRS